MAVNAIEIEDTQNYAIEIEEAQYQFLMFGRDGKSKFDHDLR